MAVGIVGTFCLLICMRAQAQLKNPKLVAGLIYRLAHFSSWSTGSDGPISVSVVDAPDLAGELAEASKQLQVQGRNFTVVDGLRQTAQATHIVFIGSESAEEFDRRAKALKGCGCLTIGFPPAGSHTSTMISLFYEEGRVAFRISNSLATQEGVLLGSELLKLARKIE